MMPYNLQKEFCNIIKDSTTSDNKNIAIYQELVFMRFDELLKSSLPLYCSIQEQSILTKNIQDFIIYGAKSPYIGKTIFEFYNFLETKKLIKLKLEKDILLFELNQLKLFTISSITRNSKFGWNKHLKLSKSTFVFKSNYELINQTFVNQIQYILIYQDKNDFEIYSIEISKFLYQLLKLLKSNCSIEQTLKLVTKQQNLKFNDVKKIIEPTLIDFTKNGIL